MSTSEDHKYFELISSTFIAPVFFFLALVMAFMVYYSLIHAPRDPHYLVLGCIMFVLGYNAWRFGMKVRGT
jgi:hypothetical protein